MKFKRPFPIDYNMMNYVVNKCKNINTSLSYRFYLTFHLREINYQNIWN